MSNIREEALRIHKQYGGKWESQSKVPIRSMRDLSLLYSPGVAEPSKAIFENKDDLYQYTMKKNTVAVVTNGTAVLGLGDIGPDAALPVMEGKAVLFKHFAGVDAVPVCINTKDEDKIIETVKLLQSSFGGINLEDITSPSCFYIEERLKQELDIPVFHDDQHGTAIVTLAGLINALKLVGKRFEDLKVVINGAGAAGIAITKLLHSFHVKDIIVCDSKGAIFKGRAHGMNALKDQLADYTNQSGAEGTLEHVIEGADVFIGVSVAGALTKDMVKKMNKEPIIFAMANPDPEIDPAEAKAAGARVIGTGRSDFPNQVNNVLAFPGIFRGALDVRATEINETMKIAAANAIAALVSRNQLCEDCIIPDPLDPRVAPAVAGAVAQAAIDTNVAREIIDAQDLTDNALRLSGLASR